jgi:hypothetical protein
MKELRRSMRGLRRAPTYLAARLVAGGAAAVWSLYVIVRTGSVLGWIVALALFAIGWFGARRFTKPAREAGSASWVDTVMPIVVALAAVLPLAFGLLVVDVRDAVPAALGAIASFLTGVLLSLASGPYRNEKVTLTLG